MDNHKAINIIRDQSEHIAAMAEKVAQHTNDLKEIKDYIVRRSVLPLNDRQRGYVDKCEWVYNNLVNGDYTEGEVWDIAAKKYFNGNKSGAWQLIHDAKTLFTEILKVDKQWELKKMLVINEIAFRKADEFGDLKSKAMHESNRIKMLSLIEDIDAREDVFEGHTLIVSSDPKELGIEPINAKEYKQLLKDLKDQFGFKLEIEDAIIIDNDTDIQDPISQ